MIVLHIREGCQKWLQQTRRRRAADGWACAADQGFEEAARLCDEIRRLEEDDLGILHPQCVAPRPVGRSSEGRPGTRKGRFGKQGRTRFGHS